MRLAVIVVTMRITIVRMIAHPLVVAPIAVAVVITVAVPADIDRYARRHHVRLTVRDRSVTILDEHALLGEGAAASEQCAACDQGCDDRTRCLVKGFHSDLPLSCSEPASVFVRPSPSSFLQASISGSTRTPFAWEPL